MSDPMRGVLILNALLLLTGLALLAGLRGFGSWVELLELLGLALVLGTCTVGVLATLVLVAGGALSTLAILGLCAAVAGTGIVLARALGRPVPRSFGALPRRSAGTAIAVVEAVATAAVLVALFRVARVMPLGGGDSWEFWVPKAKVIYFDGSIDSSFFTSLPGPRYPLFVPALLAMDFRFMGSAFGPELAVQFWFLYAGFVFASAAVLRRLVAPWLAWMFVGLTAVIPQLDARVLNSQADWALDVQFALAALVACWWLRDRERWLLVCLGILIAAVISIKQEGLLLVGVLYAGLAAGTVRSWRRTWPPLIAVGVAAYLVNLPWRLWWGGKQLPAVLPTVGLREMLHHLQRGWDSLHLVSRLLLDYEKWLAFTPLAAVAALACLTLAGRARETALIYLVTGVGAILGFTYILWSDFTYVLNTSQSATPIPRAVGSIVLFSTVMAPLLIAPLLGRPAQTVRGPETRAPDHSENG
jgi:hypothetical protein